MKYEKEDKIKIACAIRLYKELRRYAYGKDSVSPIAFWIKEAADIGIILEILLSDTKEWVGSILRKRARILLWDKVTYRNKMRYENKKKGIIEEQDVEKEVGAESCIKESYGRMGRKYFQHNLQMANHFTESSYHVFAYLYGDREWRI